VQRTNDIHYTLTIQAKAGPAVQESALLHLVDLEHYVARRLADYDLTCMYTSSTAEVSEPPEPHQYVLDITVGTLRTAHRDRWTGKQKVLLVEISAMLKHLASGKTFGKHVARQEYNIFGNSDVPEALRKTAKEISAIVASDINNGGTFGTVLRASPPLPDTELEKPDWEARLLDAQDSVIETNEHSAAWYTAAAKARRTEILAQAAETRRQKAKRRLDAHAVDEERQRIAAYARHRYRLDEAAVAEMLHQHDEREFRLLQEAIRIQQGGSGDVQ
jgi:hypothetical protein